MNIWDKLVPHDIVVMSFKGLLSAAQCLSAMHWGNNSGQTQNGSAHLGIWNILVMFKKVVF